jgi:hypothetical protein
VSRIVGHRFEEKATSGLLGLELGPVEGPSGVRRATAESCFWEGQRTHTIAKEMFFIEYLVSAYQSVIGS